MPDNLQYHILKDRRPCVLFRSLTIFDLMEKKLLNLRTC